ncbi:MAG: transporter [Oscillospiraceae bacterium]|nr:transporter [Oscillospiraceae bacterium]
MKTFILLHILFFFFSVSTVLSKYASAEEFFSFPFLLYFGASVTIMFAYSIFWQIILQKTSLVLAYSNRGIIVIWGILWGMFLFNERLNIATIIAALLIFSGIIIVGGGGDEKSE